jgi:hypothetical protein
MLGDRQDQKQAQHVSQGVNIQGQKGQFDISCDFYTNERIESLETRIKKASEVGQFSIETTLASELKKEREVIALQHQGHITQVICKFLEDSVCKSSKNSGKRCYLLGPAPAGAMIT